MEAHEERLESEGKSKVTVGQYYWSRGHCIVILVTKIEPISRRLGAIIGDGLQNLNSALDHIAWELVVRGRTPPKTLSEGRRKKIHFPLMKEPPNKKESWIGLCKEALPGVGPRQRAILRRYQPFRVGKRRTEFHRLFVIRELANHDKHRIVQRVIYRTYDTTFAIRGYDDFKGRRVVIPPGPTSIQVGTEIGRIYGRRTGLNPYAYVDIGGGVEPAFERGIWLGDSLRLAGGTILGVIKALEETF